MRVALVVQNQVVSISLRMPGSRSVAPGRGTISIAELKVPEKAKHLLERHATLFILSFRFIYGLRNLGAVAVALSDVPTRRFVVLNAIAALLWSVLVIGAGYIFGEAAASLLDQLASLQKQLLAVGGLLAFAAVASIVLRRWLLNKLK